MTIVQTLQDNTPLPLDIIKFCIEPFLIHDAAYWRGKFDNVLKDIAVFKIVGQLYDGTAPRRLQHNGQNVHFGMTFDEDWGRGVVTYIEENALEQNIISEYARILNIKPKTSSPYIKRTPFCYLSWDKKPLSGF